MKALTDAWYRESFWLILLRPLSSLFQLLARRRRQAYETGKKSVTSLPVPVLVVGNITVGGSGKTPVVVALIEWALRSGYRPGVISRGYGASPATGYPFFVDATTDPAEGGDEPCLIARRTGIPVAIDPDRPAAGRLLIEQHKCDLLISDDGLQHYALGRTIEIAVVDGNRGLGNKRCLPEGPLRETEDRLDEVDLVVLNGSQRYTRPEAFEMQLEPQSLISLGGNERRELAKYQGSDVDAVAAIGHPERFFAVLSSYGLSVNAQGFPDHHAFSKDDFAFRGDRPLLMTEKDAVKCHHLTLSDSWYLAVSADLPVGFYDKLESLLQKKLEH